jgi:hypothetical protein
MGASRKEAVQLNSATEARRGRMGPAEMGRGARSPGCGLVHKPAAGVKDHGGSGINELRARCAGALQSYRRLHHRWGDVRQKSRSAVPGSRSARGCGLLNGVHGWRRSSGASAPPHRSTGNPVIPGPTNGHRLPAPASDPAAPSPRPGSRPHISCPADLVSQSPASAVDHDHHLALGVDAHPAGRHRVKHLVNNLGGAEGRRWRWEGMCRGGGGRQRPG